MIHHLSITARDPERVATVLAEVIGGEVVVPPQPSSFHVQTRFVCAADSAGTMLVVEPWDVAYLPGDDSGLTMPQVAGSTPEYSATHALIGAKVDVETLAKIFDREKWPWTPVDYTIFRVVNVWVEGRQLIEFATADMLPDYLACYGPGGSALPGSSSH